MKFLKASIENVISTLNLIATAVPYIWLSLLGTLAVAVRFSLGRWPIVYRDDFTRGPVAFLVSFSAICLLLLLASPVAWIVTGSFLVRKERNDSLKNRAIIYLLGLVVFLILNWVDPTGFFEWFWD